MTEEQKATYRLMLRDGRGIPLTDFEKKCLAALEACWADREELVVAMKHIEGMSRRKALAGAVAGDALKKVGESPWEVK